MKASLRGKVKQSIARKKRIRRRIKGTQERPRFCVRRSARYIYAQVVDDVQGRSLVQVSSRCKEVQDREKDGKGKVVVSKILGNMIGEKVIALGIKKVVFDRGGYPYHGRVKAVAEGAREKGLEF